jgi:hypothetical protein
MNGKMDLPMNLGRKFVVYGGPFRDLPTGMLGVKMAKEIRLPCTISIPTVDFSVPDVEAVDNGLAQAVTLILDGKPLYFGCAGGIGRTGLMLAILAKAWGVEDPVKYVRSQYIPHAVETAQQQKFVADYVVPKHVLDKISSAKFWSWFWWFSPMVLTEETAVWNTMLPSAGH